MKVSVIIPSYNGAGRLPVILGALREQSFSPFEILVLLDGSTDNSLEVLETMRSELSELRFFRQENGGRAVARNSGAMRASGELVIFLDDDMIPQPDCIAEHVRHHKHISGSILTGASFDVEDETSTDFQRYKSFLTRKWSEPLEQFAGKPLDRSHIFITAANFSLSKSLFDQLQGFDVRLRDTEDFDLAMRATEAGIPLYYSSKALAFHNDRVTAAAYVKRQREYTRSFRHLCNIKPELCSKFPSRTTKLPQGLKRMIYGFFTGDTWVKLIDKPASRLLLLPRRARYRFYTLVIAANGVFFSPSDASD